MSLCVQMVPLYSGSSGNSIFLQFGRRRFLVDVGCSCKRISEALHSIGQNPADLDGVFITHHHTDHVQGLDVFTRKYGIPIYATEGSWRGIRFFEKKPHDAALDRVVFPGEAVRMNEVRVDSFPTPHDAEGSVGYRFSTEDYSMAVLTDLGYVSEEILACIKGCDAVLIEANYNHEMLWNGPYPWHLKKRVDGRTGHLCNSDCGAVIRDLIAHGTKQFVLGHLSQENNSPRTAMREIEEYLQSYGLLREMDYQMEVASRYQPSAAVLLYSDGQPVRGVQPELVSLFAALGDA